MLLEGFHEQKTLRDHLDPASKAAVTVDLGTKPPQAQIAVSSAEGQGLG